MDRDTIVTIQSVRPATFQTARVGARSPYYDEPDYSSDSDQEDPARDKPDNHLFLRCIDAQDRHCVVCTALSRFGEPPTVYEEEDLRLVQYMDEFETCIEDLVRSNAILPGSCVNPDAQCTRLMHRRENLVVLCPPHARAFKSRNCWAKSLLILPKVEDINMMIDEEAKEVRRCREWHRRGKPGGVFVYKTVDEIARDCQFDQFFSCLLEQDGKLQIFDIELRISPLFPLINFVDKFVEMPDFRLSVDEYTIYPPGISSDLRDLRSIGSGLYSDLLERWRPRHHLFSYVLRVDEMYGSRIPISRIRHEWLALNPHVRPGTGSDDSDTEDQTESGHGRVVTGAEIGEGEMHTAGATSGAAGQD